MYGRERRAGKAVYYTSNRIKSKKSDIGILVCGSGTGMAISANKIKGVRAAVCYNQLSTRLSRLHNNANIIALGSRITKKKPIGLVYIGIKRGNRIIIIKKIFKSKKRISIQKATVKKAIKAINSII